MTDDARSDPVSTVPAAAKSAEAMIGDANLPVVADHHGKAVQRTARKREREREPSIVNIATAIATITREVGVVPKSGYNAFHRYPFAKMEDVLQRLTPLLAKHGIVIVQTEIGRNMFDDDRAVAVEYEFTIAHQSGEIWPDRPRQTGLCRCRDSKGGFDDKAFNKCHTAARKYFLLALFQIATGDEDDADRGEGRTHIVNRAPPRPAPNPMLKPLTEEAKQRAAQTARAAGIIDEPFDPETGEIIEAPTEAEGRQSASASAAERPVAASSAADDEPIRERDIPWPDVEPAETLAERLATADKELQAAAAAMLHADGRPEWSGKQKLGPHPAVVEYSAVERLERTKKELTEVAKHQGTPALAKAWANLAADLMHALEHEKETTYKPIARATDLRIAAAKAPPRR